MDFEKAYNFDKTDTAAISNYAQALNDRRNYFLAREKYIELINAGSTSVDAYQQLFTLSFNMKKYEDVVKYGQLLQKEKPDENVSFNIGKAYAAMEDYASAIPALDKAMKEEPYNGEIPYAKAKIYLDMGNAKNATDMFVKAIELQPDNYDWMYEAAIAFDGFNDMQSSLRYMQMAAEKGHPLTSDFKFNLALAYKNTGHLDSAAIKLDELLNRRPTDVDALSLRAKTAFQGRAYDTSIFYLLKVLSIDEKNSEAMYMIGICYLKKGDNQQGEQWISKSAAISPSFGTRRRQPLTGYQ